ncbi:aminoglycoside phosphotransferase family protein [Shewanella acanthi]|uniref:aminoglycoside phosphotransferase family protein n=1 Tax=Shewanella acanthi TaxID=2864212 RepID=UPI001C65C669|nr:aminoglycoside phosphotransferase family protein [Shewanella acanthi]QYJ78573.1 aminoglycoside phosphotransferase family protein [Shewanella acanthi]
MINLIRQSVLPHFGIEAEEAKISALGNGHINDTLLVRWPAGELVLQRINTQVFKTPQALVSNADKISHHLCTKALAQQYGLQVISPCLTQEGELAIDLGDKGFWRAISYLPHSLSIEVVKSEAEAEMAAKAFGHFACALSDFDATQLEDVIPQFHHLPGRMAMLKEAVAKDRANRLASCREWVDFAFSQQSLLDELAEVSPQLPLRICHNDTKINNMLFDKRDMSSMAVIDLDTCMKGHLMYDFGDMVRTFCSPEAEDSTALDNVKVRQSIFAAICRGYLSELGDTLTAIEKDSLWLGARVICLMIGVRFLTDYLNGDVYFHVHREGHNLDRAANQFTLYQSLLDQQVQLKACF